MSPAGDGNWTIAITLRMLPVPQQIHNVESVLAIQNALIENVLEYVPGFEEAYVRDFARQLRSPIEFSMMLAPAPAAIISMNLDIPTADAFEQMINGVVIAESSLTLVTPAA